MGWLKPTLKMLPTSWIFGKGIRSCHARNIGSVGQRAAKVLAVKVGVL